MSYKNFLNRMSNGPAWVVPNGDEAITPNGKFCYKRNYSDKMSLQDKLAKFQLELEKGQHIAPGCYLGIYSVVDNSGGKPHQVVEYRIVEQGQEGGQEVVDYLLKMLNIPPAFIHKRTNKSDFFSLGEMLQGFHVHCGTPNEEGLSFKTQFLGRTANLVQFMPQKYEAELVENIIKLVKAKNDYPEPTDSVYLHGNAGPHNLVWAPNGKLAIFNPSVEGAISDPLQDLAELAAPLYARLNMVDKIKSLLQGYGAGEANTFYHWLGYYLLLNGAHKLTLSEYANPGEKGLLRKDGIEMLKLSKDLIVHA